jgi:hypothetical protein
VAINSWFYDSVDGDRPYSASQFADAFDVITETGIMPKDLTGALGFDIGGTNYTTIYSGKAVVEGRFVEVTGTEILTVPAGTYSGQIVIQVDSDDARSAALVVKMDQNPIQTASLYELPLYNVTVTNNLITAVTDVRTKGGVGSHIHVISEISGLVSALDAKADDSNSLTWAADPNGVKCTMGKFNGTGKPVVLFLTTARPAAVSSEHRVWIQIDYF